MTAADLIAEIETFADRHGIKPATVTSAAVGNSRLHARLRGGGSCTLDIAARLRAYMAERDARENENGVQV